MSENVTADGEAVNVNPSARESLEEILDFAMATEANEIRRRHPDLAPFCSGKWGPFSDGGWTYATDGKICIRVPRRPDVPDREWPEPDASALFLECHDCRRPLDAPDLPPENREKCPCCGDRGYITNYDDLGVEVNGSVFSAGYIAILGNLPNVRISGECVDHPVGGTMMPFKFDGGEGLLMSLKGIAWTTVRKNETWERALKAAEYWRVIKVLLRFCDLGLLEHVEDDGWMFRVSDDAYDALFANSLAVDGEAEGGAL